MELPLAEAHLAKPQAILGEAIMPEKVDVVLAPNEFNQAIRPREEHTLLLPFRTFRFWDYPS
jgi:hypothetical protein